MIRRRQLENQSIESQKMRLQANETDVQANPTRFQAHNQDLGFP